MAGVVGSSINQFSILASADETTGSDESLPLHLHGVSDNMLLRVSSTRVMVHVASYRGDHLYYTVPKTMTIRQLKQTFRSRSIFSDDTKYLIDLWPFLKRDDHYWKLDDDVIIGTTLRGNDVICFAEDRIFFENQMVPVYYEGREAGRVGAVDGDTVLSLKLRVQELMGFPVKCLDYKQSGESWENDKNISFYYSRGQIDVIDELEF